MPGERIRDRCGLTPLTLTLSSLAFLATLALCENHQTDHFARQDNCPGQVVGEDNCPVTMVTRSRLQCGVRCGQSEGCVSYWRHAVSGLCHMCTVTVTPDCINTVAVEEQRVTAFEKRCYNGGQRLDGLCQCPDAFTGDLCQLRMTDCVDWADTGETGTGSRWVFPTMSPQPFRTLCHFTWGRFLVMRRNTAALDFYRTWAEYREGFGEVWGDHWLGLERLHQLTQSRCYTLVFQLNLANSTYYQRYYTRFQVSSQAEHYSMTFDSSFSWVNPVGDCLSDVKGQPFSTYDSDHDDDVNGSCAERHHSGWWFGGANCTLCNPTGILRQPSDMVWQEDPQDVFWWPGLDDVVPRTLFMALKRC